MEKVLRSLIHEVFPLDLRVKIALLSKRRDLVNAEKQDELFKLLREFNIDATPLGPGTNRYAFKIGGFVIKMATDRDGVIDNKKEFLLSPKFPRANFMRVYEISDNGTLLVCEYIQTFGSYGEFYQYADRIREVLRELSSVYLVGDTGITAKNYSNWGLRVGSDEPVCLDYAYSYDVSSSLLLCHKCKNNSMLVPDKDFVKLVCPSCGATYEFSDIRRRIGDDLHNHEIGDLSEESYVMTESNVLTQLDIKRSPYLKPEVVKKEEPKPEETEAKDPVFQMNLFKEDENMLDTTNVSFRKPMVIKATASIAEPAEEKEDVIAFSGAITGHAVVCDLCDSKNLHEGIPEDNTIQVLQTGNTESVGISPYMKTSTISDPIYFKSHPDDPRKEFFNVPNRVDVLQSEDEEEEDLSDEPIAQVSNSGHIFHEDFLKNVHYAASHVSNSVIKTIDQSNLYDQCKGDLTQKNIFAGDFSRAVAGALYKAIVGFCNFTQIQLPNREGEGTHRGYAAPEKINGEIYMPTMCFLEATYLTNELKNIDECTALVAKYEEMYEDHPLLQREIIPIFRNELSKRLKIRGTGIEKIVHFLDDDIFDPIELHDAQVFTNAFVEAASEPEDTTLKDKIDAAIAADPKQEVTEDDINKILANAAESVFETAAAPKEEVAFSAPVEEEGATEEPAEESGSGEGTVAIYVMHEDDTDIIKVETEDSFGQVHFPCYVKLDEVNIAHTIPSMVNERNGYWDFLVHLVPSLMFRTDDPDKYLAGNDEDITENQIHPVILDELETNEYVMGIYLVAGIYDVDDEGNCTQITDVEMIKKINKVLLDVLSTTSMSHLARTIARKDLVQDESIIADMVDYIEVEDDDEDVEEPNVEASNAAVQAVLDNQPATEEESLIFEPIFPKKQ